MIIVSKYWGGRLYRSRVEMGASLCTTDAMIGSWDFSLAFYFHSFICLTCLVYVFSVWDFVVGVLKNKNKRNNNNVVYMLTVYIIWQSESQ